jgi:general secretion pathway protein J
VGGRVGARASADLLSQDHGFTLIEILVAVVVFGFVVAGLVQATHFGITAWDVQTRMVERADELERVDHVLRALVEQASPPLAADDKPFNGTEHRLDFITRLPLQPPTDPIRRAEVIVGVNEQHQLVVRWQQKPNATPLKPVPPPQEIVLAEGVDHFDLTYRQAGGDGGKWMRTWDDTSLPALVLMTIVMQNTSHKWPTIQAATMLDNNGSF